MIFFTHTCLHSFIFFVHINILSWKIHNNRFMIQAELIVCRSMLCRCCRILRTLEADVFVGWSGSDQLPHRHSSHFFTVRQSSWLKEEIRVFVGGFTLKWHFSLPFSLGCFDREGSFTCHSGLSMSAAGLSTHPYIWIKQSESLQRMLLTF